MWCMDTVVCDSLVTKEDKHPASGSNSSAAKQSVSVFFGTPFAAERDEADSHPDV